MSLTIKDHIELIKMEPKLWTKHFAPQWVYNLQHALTKKRFIGTENNLVIDTAFWLYLKLDRMVESRVENHDVCDHLGVIDTLGYSRYTNWLTGSYHSEMVDAYWINLGFGFVIAIEICCSDRWVTIAHRKNLK